MAQLKDDCFAFGGELINIDVALRDIETRLSVVCKTETVPIDNAYNRVIAENIISPRNVPPQHNSAVDGYAVYFDDIGSSTNTYLPVTARIAAGHPLGREARRGEAFRIFTGAPIPHGPDGGPDTIYMDEDCTLEGDKVILPPGLNRGSNKRTAGEDIRKGEVIISTGKQLRAQEVGLIASVGRDKVEVYERLKVAIFSTGDEICDPTDDASDNDIFDANRFSIIGLLDTLGCKITDIGILPDNKGVIADAIAATATNHNMLITSGGVSAGEEDHVKAAVECHGSINFWRFAIKPGRPIALGQVGNAAFVGLPGNPVAAMVTFMVIARPMVKLLSGAINYTAYKFKVPANFDYKKKKGRREWVRSRLKTNKYGNLVADRFLAGGSGILTSMVDSQGLVELGEKIEVVDKGDLVEFLPFSEVMQ